MVITRLRLSSPKITSFLSIIFFFSGFTSLIYQIVWQRLLTLYYGVGAISITLIVSIYMFGLGGGALLGGFLAERIRSKIKLYFIVELCIGLFGLISLFFLGFLGRYTSGSNYSVALFYMFLFLSVPTLLMGTTLPLLTKIFNRFVNDFLNTVSFLYFINTIGASVGAVFASYVIISFFGLDTAIYCAVLINFILAVLIFLLHRVSKNTQIQITESSPDFQPTLSEQMPFPWAYFLVFITGFLAIGYEIVWFRIVAVLVKSSPYVFSTVLAVYLLGIALGSYWMSIYLRQHKGMDRKSLFFNLQFLIGFSVVLIMCGYYYFTKYTPFENLTRLSFSMEIHPHIVMVIYDLLFSKSLLVKLQNLFVLFDIFFWSFVFVFIPTLFMGASFPLISFLMLSDPKKEAKTVGIIYFFNILGNILGGIITGFILLTHWGTEHTLLLFSSVGLFLGLFTQKFLDKFLALRYRLGLIIILLAINFIFSPKKGEFYRLIHLSAKEQFPIYLEEGVEGVVVTYEHDGQLINYINGLGHGGRPGYHFFQKTIEAVSFTPRVNDVLIIGFGTGSTVEMISKLDEVKNITVVELNGTLMKNLTKMTLFQNILKDPRVHLIIDDGRRFLSRTDQKFDLVYMDCLRSTTAYSNNLYSKEFFELVKAHLNPGGVLKVWLTEYLVIPKTMLSVFDHYRMYASFCLVSNQPLQRNEERTARLLSMLTQEEREEVMRISRLTRKEGGQNAGRFLGDGDDGKLFAMTKIRQYPINQDLKPVTEYYFGLLCRKYFLNRESFFNFL